MMATSLEGTNTDSLTGMHGLHQQISDLTHLLPNSLSCIDLIFTDSLTWQLIVVFILPNCHHQIIYCKFNLMIEYPSSYEPSVWDYNHANQKAIAKALDRVTEMVYSLTKMSINKSVLLTEP